VPIERSADAVVHVIPATLATNAARTAENRSKCVIRPFDRHAGRFSRGLNEGMASGWVGILSAELHFPEAHSLKEKRMYVRSAREQLRNRFGAAVAEVDHHDVWQRARLTVAVVTREAGEAQRLLADAERYLASREWELGRLERELVTLDDE
jgi:uncharacterized protein YlxP (DUF503 family)